MEATEQIACPLCGSKQFSVHRKSKDRYNISDEIFTLVKCNECSLVYQNPRVPPDKIYKFYPNNYYKSRPGRNKINKQAIEINLKKVELIETYAKNPGKMLEVGSANGDFLVEMRNRGWNVKGVEVSEDGCKYAKEHFNLDVFNGELHQMPQETNDYDVVVMWAVFPHIHNPMEIVNRAVSLLKPGGNLIILVANIESYASEYMKDNWGHLDQPRHYTMWGPTSMTALYKKVGIELQEIIHHDNIYNSNFKFNFLYPFIKTGSVANKNFIQKAIKYSAIYLNKYLSQPVLEKSRKAGKSGIITAIGKKH